MHGIQNVGARPWRVVMDTVALQRYRVTVALPRPAGDGGLVPPGAQVLAEAAAAAGRGRRPDDHLDRGQDATVDDGRVAVPVGRALGRMGGRAGAWRHGRRDRGG